MANGISRRQWLERVGWGATALSATGWMGALAEAAPERPRTSVVLLWLNGGPATIDLWDPRPGHPNGGPVQAIPTATPGLRLSEYLPKLAAWTDKMAFVRSMTSKEGDHARAVHFVRTGYVPQAAIDFPDWGAALAKATAAAGASLDSDKLPRFVSIGPPQRTGFAGSGFLGPRHAPLVLGKGAKLASELRAPHLEPAAGVSAAQNQRRQELLAQADREFVRQHGPGVAQDYAVAQARARRMMRPEVAGAFNLAEESDAVVAAYGGSLFGQGCLLARRLLERGVSFVEVSLDGWDTHQDNFPRVKGLAGQLDRAFASLLNDLQTRGRLESTLVVCLGEFGRTPKINRNAGRDHWPQVWAAALAGRGFAGGAAIGKATADGLEVDERPCTVPDLVATVCRLVGVDPREQNLSNVGRPIRIADPEAQPIEELL